MKFSLVTLATVAATASAFTTPMKPTSSSVAFAPAVTQSNHVSPFMVSPLFAAKGIMEDTAMGGNAMPEKPSEGQIRSLFYLWNDALATGDSRIVAKRYASNTMLLPTVSDTPRCDFDSIKDYFDDFLALKPQGIILDGK